MKRSTIALTFAALLGFSLPCSGQFFFPFSTGPLPIYGTRFRVAAPVVSGASFRAYGYSYGAYGVSDGTNAGTYTYGYRVPRTRLRRALWIFQPKTTVSPQQPPNSPQQPPDNPPATPPTTDLSTYIVGDDNKQRIEDAIAEAKSWPTLTPQKPPETTKLDAGALTPDDIRKAYQAEQNTDKDGRSKKQLLKGFQDLVTGVTNGTLRNGGAIISKWDGLVSSSQETLRGTRTAIRDYLRSTRYLTNKRPVWEVIR